MLPVIIGAASGVAALAAWAWKKKKDAHAYGVLTPDRELIYSRAINNLQDPEKLRKLAAGFREQGLKPQAEMLEKRAGLRELPRDVKAKRRETFKKLMQSDDIKKILEAAQVFEEQSATGSALRLRERATALQAKLTQK